MTARYSIVGIAASGHRTTIMINVGEREARVIADRLQTVTRYERVELVQEPCADSKYLRGGSATRFNNRPPPS